MAHKYLEEAGISPAYLPENYAQYYFAEALNEEQKKKWAKERETCGFDSRETWNLDNWFFVWFFERLSMFNEVNNIDTKHPTEVLDDGTNFQAGIDETLELLKFLILFDESDYDYNNYKTAQEEWRKHYDRFIHLFGMLLPRLVW